MYDFENIKEELINKKEKKKKKSDKRNTDQNRNSGTLLSFDT